MTTAQSITTNPTLQSRIAVMSRGDEDRAQEMYLALLERERRSPKFAKQQIGYQITAAKWAGKMQARANATYDKYVECETVLTDDDGHEVSVFDTLVANEPTVEEQVEQSEVARDVQKAIAALPENQRKIAHLLMQGYAPFEIAKKLGTDKSNISHIMARMRKTLAVSL